MEVQGMVCHFRRAAECSVCIERTNLWHPLGTINFVLYMSQFAACSGDGQHPGISATWLFVVAQSTGINFAGGCVNRCESSSHPRTHLCLGGVRAMYVQACRQLMARSPRKLPAKHIHYSPVHLEKLYLADTCPLWEHINFDEREIPAFGRGSCEGQKKIPHVTRFSEGWAVNRCKVA